MIECHLLKKNHGYEHNSYIYIDSLYIYPITLKAINIQKFKF